VSDQPIVSTLSQSQSANLFYDMRRLASRLDRLLESVPMWTRVESDLSHRMLRQELHDSHLTLLAWLSEYSKRGRSQRRESQPTSHLVSVPIHLLENASLELYAQRCSNQCRMAASSESLVTGHDEMCPIYLAQQLRKAVQQSRSGIDQVSQ
jgi:hypothetical protein